MWQILNEVFGEFRPEPPVQPTDPRLRSSTSTVAAAAAADSTAGGGADSVSAAGGADAFSAEQSTNYIFAVVNGRKYIYCNRNCYKNTYCTFTVFIFKSQQT